MRKINWLPRGSRRYVRARIGCIVLQCWPYINKWLVNASIQELSGTFRYSSIGHKSLVKAKEDAIRLGRELLLDYQASLNIEMKNFDL